MSQFLEEWEEANSELKRDGLIKKGISQMLDADLRDRWSSLLKTERGQKKKGGPRRKNTSFILRGLAVAATIAILIIAGRFLFVNNSLSLQAHSYLQETIISHPGVAKGLGQKQVEQRAKAIAFYSNGDYQSAADQFSSLHLKTEEDLFFQAVANLYAENYQTAISQFGEIRKKNDGLFQEEIKWYQALALLVEGQKDEAAIILQSIESTHWHGKQAGTLLSQLRP